MKNKRTSIKNQIRKLIVITAVMALLFTSISGIISMYSIRRESADSLTDQLKETVDGVVDGKASLADSKLGLYADYVTTLSDVITDMYSRPDAFVPKEVLPPDASKANIFSMQRYFTTHEVKREDVLDDLCLMGNLEDIFKAIISEHSDVVTTLFLATDEFMVCCDGYAHYAELDPDGESYYDYRQKNWYRNAMDGDGKAGFIKTNLDFYGRGLYTSCSAPFYKNGERVGVVCISILTGDLNSEIIDVQLGNGSYAFLVDADGDIIASPYMKRNSLDFINVSRLVTSELKDRMLGGGRGVERTDDGIYYAYAPIKSTGWEMVISIPESEILKPIEQMDGHIRLAIIFFIIFFVLVITAVFFFGLRLAKRFTEPIIALEKDVEVISGGNLQHKAMVRANNELGDLAHCVNSMAVSLDNYINDLTRITAEKERIGAELDVATHIQSSMLPCIFPAFPDRKEFDVYASMTPAKEVGGDFYDFFMVDDSHVAFVVADVSGKGVPAALFMVIGKTLIKDHTMPDADLETVFMEVNNMLCESNSENMFITAFECVLDLKTGELRFINAGHETPFIYRKGGQFEEYPVKACFVLAGMENMVYKGGSCMLEPGDKLFQYTDGVTEATDANNELYGMERLNNILRTVGDKTPDEILPIVKADIDAFVKDAPQFDDITMLCFEFKQYME